MPIRTYICQNDHQFERINAPRTMKCPRCGTKAKAKEWEAPARRNPAHGIQTDME
jgi:hypothetical protein